MSFYPDSRDRLLEQLTIARAEEQQLEQPQSDSMIDYGAEHLIDLGVVLIAFTVVIIIGMFSKQVEKALLFALALSAFLIVILWNI